MSFLGRIVGTKVPHRVRQYNKPQLNSTQPTFTMNPAEQQERKETLTKAHQLVWCTKVDFNSPDVHKQLDTIGAAGLASRQLGVRTRRELEEAGVVIGNGFTHMWYVMISFYHYHSVSCSFLLILRALDTLFNATVAQRSLMMLQIRHVYDNLYLPNLMARNQDVVHVTANYTYTFKSLQGSLKVVTIN